LKPSTEGGRRLKIRNCETEVVGELKVVEWKRETKATSISRIHQN
jgi:hypothetical protein